MDKSDKIFWRFVVGLFFLLLILFLFSVVQGHLGVVLQSFFPTRPHASNHIPSDSTKTHNGYKSKKEKNRQKKQNERCRLVNSKNVKLNDVQKANKKNLNPFHAGKKAKIVVCDGEECTVNEYECK